MQDLKIFPKMGLTVTALTSEMTDSQKIEFYARYNDKRKNALIAIVLAIFLGTFGVHKFYQGKITWGIIYILFCWTGIPTIWSIVEAITMIPWAPSARKVDASPFRSLFHQGA